MSPCQGRYNRVRGKIFLPFRYFLAISWSNAVRKIPRSAAGGGDVGTCDSNSPGDATCGDDGVLNYVLCSISQPQGRHSVADRCEFGAVALLIRQLFIVR